MPIIPKNEAYFSNVFDVHLSLLVYFSILNAQYNGRKPFPPHEYLILAGIVGKFSEEILGEITEGIVGGICHRISEEISEGIANEIPEEIPGGAHYESRQKFREQPKKEPWSNS